MHPLQTTRSALRRALPCVALALGLVVQAAASTAEPVQIRVIGGLAGVRQHTQIEEPFWRERIGELSGGRLTATVHAIDRSGLRGQEMLDLMRLGVVSFGTLSPGLLIADAPELSASDLPALNPDLASLRRTVAADRPRLTQLLQERYRIALLGIYVYPAQVIYCARPFQGLGDLAGRRVRSSSASQSDMLAALGATAVITPFAEIVEALKSQTVECAITGTLSGNEIGLTDVTTHIHAMAISWGLTLFGANVDALAALPADLRGILADGVRDLEARIWDSADRHTAAGLACNTGGLGCVEGRSGRLILVPASAEDERHRRRLLVEAVLPKWIERCGGECVTAWNDTLAPVTGVRAGQDQRAN